MRRFVLRDGIVTVGRSFLRIFLWPRNPVSGNGDRERRRFGSNAGYADATGAHPVSGRMYLTYEDLGEGAALGLPTGPRASVAGVGFEQVFEWSRIYQRNGVDAAFEVHGEILRRYVATGGPATWGFPVSNETDVMSNGHPAHAIGRMSEFEGATFYWSGASGAFEVHGDIRAKYIECGGPGGELGFPTSDESNIPDAAGAARMNTFQNGSICWYGSYASIIIARPFHLFIGRVATQESEGFGMGQNDLSCSSPRPTVARRTTSRHPGSGDWGGHDSHDMSLTILGSSIPTAWTMQ